MRRAIASLAEGQLSLAEAVVRRQLIQSPENAAALCLLGDLAARSGVYSEAEKLLRAAIRAVPELTDAQFNLAKILALRDGLPEAIELLDGIVADRPERVDVAEMRLSLLGQIGDYDSAASGYIELLERFPNQPALWTAFANLQARRGDVQSSVAAFKRALALNESFGEAWWGLANLKVYRFDDREVTRLSKVVAQSDNGLLHFALGRALQDRAEPEQSFAHYVKANCALRKTLRFDPLAITAEVDRSISFFTPALMDRLGGAGHPAPDPIFILGLPRSGSTLIEQILASHPLIEGTAELPYIPMLIHRSLSARWEDRDLVYPNCFDDIERTELFQMGKSYLEAARLHRRLNRRYFIDKLPANWRYIGFIKLILPNAKIIDARREPMACLWSNYAQCYARGHEFSYDFSTLASYWRDYVRLTTHMNESSYGTVYRVEHEQLIADPERIIIDLLEALGLEFHPACLRFNETSRPVGSASAQQVRRPIDPNSNEHWHMFEPWLQNLKSQLVCGR